jgi:lipopolysaccharide transport system ATP-binding protein
VRLHRVSVRPLIDSATDSITIRTPLVLDFEYWNLEPDARLSLSLHLYNQRETLVFNTFPVREDAWHGRPFPTGLFRSSCYIPGDLLNDGVHRLVLHVIKDQGIVLFSLNDALVFNVLDAVERRGDWHGKWEGAVRPDLEWKTEYLGGEDRVQATPLTRL